MKGEDKEIIQRFNYKQFEKDEQSENGTRVEKSVLLYLNFKHFKEFCF